MDVVESRKKIGELIRRHRKQKRMTLYDAAEEADMDDKHLGRIERGEQDITLQTFGKLVIALDIHIDVYNLF